MLLGTLQSQPCNSWLKKSEVAPFEKMFFIRSGQIFGQPIGSRFKRECHVAFGQTLHQIEGTSVGRARLLNYHQ